MIYFYWYWHRFHFFFYICYITYYYFNIFHNGKSKFKINKRIIIFDDNIEKTSILKNILKPTKADISIINTTIFTWKTYDLIIIDDIVTNIENTTITNEYILKTFNSRNLKKLFDYEIPVIILVTKNNKKLEEKYLKIGFNDFIIKPITYKKVIKKIQKLLK